MKNHYITYQPMPRKAWQFKTMAELLKNLTSKHYKNIYPSLGRGIILQNGDDKEFVVIPFKSRNRVVKYLKHHYQRNP